MIRSMTGFGRASFERDGFAFDVEIRTVNHRYLDVRVKLPRIVAGCEAEARSLVQGRLQRGRVDVAISLAGDGPSPTVALDLEAAGRYLDAAARLRETRDVAGDLEVATLLSLPGVTSLREPEVSTEALEEALLEATGRALDGLEAMRVAEGKALLRDFEQRLERILELVERFSARSDLVVAAARERLRKRSAQLEQETGVLDEARLHQEIVIAADRMDISEELVRLRSHVDQFRAILAGAEADTPVGRRLDFLLQELGREANTVGSKTADAPIAHDVVELKNELERIREQVQNVE